MGVSGAEKHQLLGTGPFCCPWGEQRAAGPFCSFPSAAFPLQLGIQIQISWLHVPPALGWDRHLCSECQTPPKSWVVPRFFCLWGRLALRHADSGGRGGGMKGMRTERGMLFWLSQGIN